MDLYLLTTIREHTIMKNILSISSFTRNPWIARFVLLATIPAVAFAGTSFLQHNLVSDIRGWLTN